MRHGETQTKHPDVLSSQKKLPFWTNRQFLLVKIQSRIHKWREKKKKKDTASMFALANWEVVQTILGKYEI